MSRSQQTRFLTALAATAFAGAVVPLVGAGAASATTSGDCQSATVQYRIVDADGKPVGADWSSQGGFHQWDTVPGTVEVRLAPGQSVGDGCKYPVSLAEYTTEGPNWFVSGHQALVDKATVYLTAADVADSADAKQTWQKLEVKAPDCYGQIDLYGDDVSYDGKTGEGHGPLPYQPDNIATPYHLIAAWNGGEKPCAPATPDSPSPSQSAPATPTTPAASEPPADKTTEPASPKPSSTPSTTPDVPPLTSTPPATPSPSPSESTPPLAETGASGPLGPIAGGAALVIVAGAGAVVMSRRARRS
ncbi:hypothetical protein [Streptomyces sp. NBC_00328]|uniref:hypothetical protein n=1 Tax=Streptomyces sp. NBC_00328 TaxID=2903646 RepID=UPI002E28D56E|nr:hypothetical protein [Streptomyces sp. NBC_00328]